MPHEYILASCQRHLQIVLPERGNTPCFQASKGQEPDKIKSGEVYWYGSAEDMNVSRLWVKNVLRAYGEREET